MTQPYIVLQQRCITSKYGNKIYAITLVGALDRLEYVTYIDPNNRNFKYWQHIVFNPDSGFVLKNCVIKKDNLISADCRPTISWQTDNKEDVFEELVDIWQEQDAHHS